MNGENYIRFDWAMKRLLRNKANYVVLEGFLTSLLGKKFKIHRFLESESNQEDENDKYNRVDILAESENEQLCIIEVQNSREQTYFHRMLYGVSKWIEFLKTGSISSKATAAGLPEARERLRVDSLSQKDKQAYFRHLEAVRHMKSLFDTSRDEGYQDGLTEGIIKGEAKGRAEGRIEGRAEGRAEGRVEEKKEIALNLLAYNTPIDIIAKSTGLSIEEIKKLKS